MLCRTRRMRWIVFLALAGTAAGCIAFVVYLCKPSMVIGSRNGLRAVLLMPGNLRSFTVEEHARPGDSFRYTLKTERTGVKRWALQINTKAKHREYWYDHFSAYVTERHLIIANRYNRGSNIVLRGFKAARSFEGQVSIVLRDRAGLSVDGWLGMEQSRTSDDLDIVFVYQVRPRSSKLRRCIFFINSRIRRLWYLLGDEPPIVDVRAS